MADETAAKLDNRPLLGADPAVQPDKAHPGTWIMDGVAGVPAVVAARLVELGNDFRLATAGKVRAVIQFTFPGVGPRWVVVCEKWAGVYLPENQAPYEVQGVALSLVAALLAQLATP